MAVSILTGALISAFVWECLSWFFRLGGVPVLQRVGMMGMWVGFYYALFHID